MVAEEDGTIVTLRHIVVKLLRDGQFDCCSSAFHKFHHRKLIIALSTLHYHELF